MNGLIDLGPVLVARWWSDDPGVIDALRAAAVGVLGAAALDGPDAVFAPVGPDALRVAMDLAAALAPRGGHAHPRFTIGVAGGPARLRGDGAARVLDGPAVWRASRLSGIAAPGETWVTGELASPLPPGLGAFRAPAVGEVRFGDVAFVVRDYR